MVHTSFNRYVNEVMQSGNSSDGYVLETANAIFVNQKLELHSEYRNEVQNLYEASIRNIDFANRANKSLKEINDWAKMKTHGRIKKILNQLDPSTNMVLLNAVFFKGKWKIPFNSTHTSEYYFYNSGVKSQRKMVPIMSMTNRFFYSNFENFKALQLLYEGEQISMLILLPEKPGGLRALEGSLTSEKLSDILKNLHQTKVHVSIPKFKLQFEKDLTSNIKALGINRIFSAGTAELSGMTSSPGAFISQVVHKAVIQIDEEGTKAAAVTRMHVSRSGPHEFRVNYPFLFAILERGSKSNMVLFLGRVNVL
ncbi:serpin B10 [Trichonephila clavata]|uniref:Serpin B10 n=1 Tax=Trichonephila clavata TaxID=2740835 RepID=A0A8X6ILC1_TRICU|nr:serpin B10 [Trichonephila clavata]